MDFCALSMKTQLGEWVIALFFTIVIAVFKETLTVSIFSVSSCAVLVFLALPMSVFSCHRKFYY
jgi:hypothetical protein